MKNYLFGLVSFCFAIPAFAIGNAAMFQCETNKVIDRGNRATRFEFTVENLYKGTPAYISKFGEMEDPVKMTPANSVLMLNDNYWIGRMKDVNLKLTSDGAGCQLTTVVLYGDSGFEKGYAAVKDLGCGLEGGSVYTTVKCRVLKRK